MTDDIQTVHIDHAEAMEMLSRQSQTIERLRAENKRVRSLLHWDIAEDEEGLIICDGNHEKRLYWQSTVDELRAENEKLRAALKPAYFEGWYHGNNLRSPVHNAEQDWESSAAKAALGESDD